MTNFGLQPNFIKGILPVTVPDALKPLNPKQAMQGNMGKAQGLMGKMANKGLPKNSLKVKK